jgi:hypothetical protein
VSNLVCEYPDGCRLDLWSDVVKAKYIARHKAILDTTFCVPEEAIGGKITEIEYIQVKILSKQAEFLVGRVKVKVDYQIILLVTVADEYQVVTINETYEETIEFGAFTPAISVEQAREEIANIPVIFKNPQVDCEILGACEDPLSPCRQQPHIAGTCLHAAVWIDLIIKLAKSHDVIVYGELDPEV